MKRYTQGFKKFGPMEQCNDGEWVRFEDYEIIRRRIEHDYRGQLDNARRAIYKAKESVIPLHIVFEACVIAYIVLALVL